MCFTRWLIITAGPQTWVIDFSFCLFHSFEHKKKNRAVNSPITAFFSRLGIDFWRLLVNKTLTFWKLPWEQVLQAIEIALELLLSGLQREREKESERVRERWTFVKVWLGWLSAGRGLSRFAARRRCINECLNRTAWQSTRRRMCRMAIPVGAELPVALKRMVFYLFGGGGERKWSLRSCWNW